MSASQRRQPLRSFALISMLNRIINAIMSDQYVVTLEVSRPQDVKSEVERFRMENGYPLIKGISTDLGRWNGPYEKLYITLLLEEEG